MLYDSAAFSAHGRPGVVLRAGTFHGGPSCVSHRSLAAALCGVFLAGLMAASSAMAQPAAGIDIPYKKFVLKNGLTLLVHEDHKAPIVAVNVWYHVGSKNEKPGPDGLRAPVRAPDVQRQRALQRRLLQGARRPRRHRPQRHDQRGPHELLPERAHVGPRHGPVDGVGPDGPSARRDHAGQARRAARRRAEREAPGRERAVRQGRPGDGRGHLPEGPPVFLDASSGRWRT